MTRGDKILIIFIVIFCLISFFLISRNMLKINKKVLSIEVDGEIYDEILLIDDNMKEKIKVESEFGYNVIKIDGEDVSVIEASCPDKLDVKQGNISKVGEMIICLPNKLVIEIKGIKSETGIDRLSR